MCVGEKKKLTADVAEADEEHRELLLLGICHGWGLGLGGLSLLYKYRYGMGKYCSYTGG